jgi:hypothetical protein
MGGLALQNTVCCRPEVRASRRPKELNRMETHMAVDPKLDPKTPIPTADEIRMKLIEREMEAMEKQRAAREAEQARLAALADEFLKSEISEQESIMIRRLVMNAVQDGKLEALVYSFPSDLCSDGGRAINNNEPHWPDTLRGKARALYDRYQTIAKPAGYRLKASIITFPGGIPGDVGFFLNWAEQGEKRG